MYLNTIYNGAGRVHAWALLPCIYEWSTGEFSQQVNVCPDSLTTYYVTANANGCYSAADSVEIHVIDVRCGKHLNKVKLCFRSRLFPRIRYEMCVLPCLADFFLDLPGGQFTLGDCPSLKSSDNITTIELAEDELPGELKSLVPPSMADTSGIILTVFPNPASSTVNISFVTMDDTETTIDLLGSDGKWVGTIFKGHTYAGRLNRTYYSVTGLLPGAYICRMLSGTTAKSYKLVTQ